VYASAARQTNVPSGADASAVSGPKLARTARKSLEKHGTGASGVVGPGERVGKIFIRGRRRKAARSKTSICRPSSFTWISNSLRTLAVLGRAPFTRYNLLSNRLSNRFDSHTPDVGGCFGPLPTCFDNRLDVCLHDTAGCQTGVQPV